MELLEQQAWSLQMNHGSNLITLTPHNINTPTVFSWSCNVLFWLSVFNLVLLSLSLFPPFRSFLPHVFFVSPLPSSFAPFILPSFSSVLVFCYLRFFSQLFTLFLTFTSRSWSWMRAMIMYDFRTVAACSCMLWNFQLCRCLCSMVVIHTHSAIWSNTCRWMGVSMS